VSSRGEVRVGTPRFTAVRDTGAPAVDDDATRFNAGLTLEHNGDYTSAAASYAAITNAPLPDDAEARRTWIDAHFRRAVCLSKVGDWGGASSTFQAVLAVPNLARADELEARLGFGIAEGERGAVDEAEAAFRRIVSQARDFDRIDAQSLRGFAAEAAFRWGEIERVRFEAVGLVFPTDVLAERMQQKCEQLLRAQQRYVRSIQLGDGHTAAGAGSRIGGMYARLYDDIVALEAPAHLTAEETEVYRAEVRSRVRVLVAKAIRIYERAALAGKRTSTAERWVEESEAALARLRAIYLEDGAL
jgi:hypothetical protein